MRKLPISTYVHIYQEVDDLDAQKYSTAEIDPNFDDVITTIYLQLFPYNWANSYQESLTRLSLLVDLLIQE